MIIIIILLLLIEIIIEQDSSLTEVNFQRNSVKEKIWPKQYSVNITLHKI